VLDAQTGQRRPLRVLLAEDHGPTAKLMSMMLRKLGCVVTVVDNGVMAINAFKRLKPDEKEDATQSAVFDVVLMDGNMPKLGKFPAVLFVLIGAYIILGCVETDGYEATAALREMGVTIPVLALTGNALMDDQNRFTRAGANAILIKPVTSGILQAALAQFLPSWRN